MGWFVYAFIAASLNGIVDFMFKLSSDKINSSVGGIILNLVGIIPLVLLTIYFRQTNQEIQITKQGVLFMVIAGLSVGFITLALFKMFSTGQAVSVATPVMRTMGILFASSLGIMFLKEPVSVKYALGFILSTVGIFLISTS